MMRTALTKLNESRFDVIIIGGGINGASAAQQLAAAGYRCLVAEKSDFGSGASGRSSRMLHIGLRFFENRSPVAHFARHPTYFLEALKGARASMLGVSEHLSSSGGLVTPYRMCFPVYRDGDFKTWHLRAGLRMLGLLGDGSFSLDSEIVTNNFAERIPFFADMRDPDKLASIACYNEYKIDWPERFCVDMLLDAERNGATVLNYCRAAIVRRKSNNDWLVSLSNGDLPNASTAEVSAPIVLNLAGTWTDELIADSSAEPIVHMTKGSHIVVELPKTYDGFGIAGVNRLGTPFYVLPLHKRLFSVGVTELPFNGDAGDVTCSDEEADFLIDEFNTLLPGRRLQRSDVVSTWAGVRPLSRSGEGSESRVLALHDLSQKAMPGVFALTGAPIMSHRSSGRMLLDAVKAKLQPMGQQARPNYAPFAFTPDEASPAFLADEPAVRIADLENSVTREHAKSLTDVLLRRTSLAWRRRLTRAEAGQAAAVVGPLLGWSEAQQQAQVDQFIGFQESIFRRPCATIDENSEPRAELGN